MTNNRTNLQLFDTSELQQRIKQSHILLNTPSATDDAGLVLARMFYSLDPAVFTVQYPELTWLETGVNISNIGGISHSIQKIRVEPKGSFKESSDGGDNKGVISLSAEADTIAVKKYYAKSDWNEDEIAEAQLQNRNLVADYISGMNLIYQRENDRYFYNGTGSNKGILNNSYFSSTNSTGLAINMNGDQLFEAISNLIVAQHTEVSNIPAYMANVCVLPINVLNIASVKNQNTAGGVIKVMRNLKETYSEVKFLSSTKCGNGSNSVSIAFSNRAEVMNYRLPIPLTIGKIIQTASFSQNMEAKYRTAGIDISERKGGRKLIGL